MKYLTILVLLLIVSSEQILCPQNQTTKRPCSREHIPVCGYFLTGQLPQTFSNSCQACQQEGIVSYEQGNCKEEIPRNLEASLEASPQVGTTSPETATTSSGTSTSSSGTTTSSSSNTTYKCSVPKIENPICPAVYRPTCGLYNKNIQCIKAPCGQVYGNECEACGDKNVDEYFIGDCSEFPQTQPEIPPVEQPQDDYKKCTDPRPEMCTLEYIDTCGFTEYPCYSDSCLRKASNGCNACSDKSVIAYKYQACSEYAKMWQRSSDQQGDNNTSTSPSSTVTKCTIAKSQNPVCPEYYKKTCGLFNQSIQCAIAPCGQVYENDCFACSDEKVDSYYFGDCNELNQDNKTNVENPSESDYVKCSEPRPEMCTQQMIDTCAFTEFPCYSDSCMKQSSNGCSACQDKTVTGYIQKSCQDYQLIYTTQQPQTTGTSQTEEQISTHECDSNRPTTCDQNIAEVCVAYQCEDSTCYKEYTNKCLACMDTQTTKYNTGKCLTMNSIILSSFAFLITLII